MSELTVIQNTSRMELPALIIKSGDRIAWRFVEFFTVNIRNKNTLCGIESSSSIEFSF
jgi:hypothetical protein